MAERDLVVRIIGDEKDLVRAFDRSSRSAQQFEGRVSKINRAQSNLFKAGVAGIGVGIVFRQLDAMTEAASNLNEEVNKSDVVFGKSAQEVQRWAKTTTDGFGISNRAALQAASGFGQMLETSGATEKQAASMSRALVELGGDLASFNNITTDEALLKLRSGLAGEAEPLRVLGVQLSEARVQQQAYASGIANTGDKLTEQQKVLARYQIIMKDTAKAQGDAGRTSGELAGQQRILAAEIEDLNAAGGELALQVLPPIIKGLNLMAQGAINAISGIKRLRANIEGWNPKDPTEGFFTGLSRTLGQIKDAPGLSDLRDSVRGLVKDSDVAIDKLQELDFTATKLLTGQAFENKRTPKVPSFGQPGFKPGGAPAVPLGPDADQLNRIFDARVTRELDRVADQDLRKQLASLDKIAAGIDAEIARVKDVTRKLTLRDELLGIRRRQADIRAQLAEDFLDSLDLGLERARMTKTLSDDLAALDRLEAAVQAQIRKGGRTNALQRRLLAIDQERASIAEQQKQAAEDAAQAARDARQAKQFRQLGLTAEGEEPVPGVGALRRRLAQLSTRLQGTPQLTRKVAQQMERIRNVLKGKASEIGPDVRNAIDRMFDEIAGSFDRDTATIKRQKIVDIDDLLAGTGVSPAEIRKIKATLGRLGPQGQIAAGSAFGGAFGLPAGGRNGGGTTVIQEVNVYSPQDFAAFERELERQAQRTSGKRSGHRAGNKRK